jgi:hypothetical protein
MVYQAAALQQGMPSVAEDSTQQPQHCQSCPATLPAGTATQFAFCTGDMKWDVSIFQDA